MPFCSDLQLRHRPGHDRWELAIPLSYQSLDGRHVTVPALYRTDLASVPRVVWRLVPRDYVSARRPAVIHDYIYSHLTHRFTRREADQIFRDSLLEEGMGKVLAGLMWGAVRIGGRGNWRTM